MSAPDTLDVLEVCEEAMDLPPTEREAWLQAQHGHSPHLVAAVRRLLARDTASGRLLPTDFAPPLPAAEPLPPPARVGVYRLEEVIGEGGMGSVYRAERDDGLFDHTVAVKLVSGRQLDRRASERFAVERQALARLKHPNIARLLDGGVTADGIPYLLMDYVEGVTILEYVEAHDPPARQLVELLLQVCDAVADAHRRLVVHGDLKPSNILVTPAGEARLLDFGVARLTDIAPETELLRSPLTAAYASPERLAGEPATTADDVFGLGVLTRELLSRSGPSSGDRAASALPRDLAAIAAKATSADPRQRYGSAGAMAADLRRWLGREPVLARGGGSAYVLGRFLARRPRFSAAAAAALLGLGATATVSTVLFFQAEAARADATRRFDDARSMAKYMLFGLYDQLVATPQSLTVRRDLANRGQAYLDQLSADARAPMDVRLEAVDGLARLASVQGGVTQANLGQSAAARGNLQRAGKIATELSQAHPERPDVWLSLARARIGEAALAAQADNQPADADRLLQQAGAALLQARRTGGGEAAAQVQAEFNLEMAAVRQWQGRYADSIKAAHEAVAALRGLSSGAQDWQTQLLLVRAYDVLAESTYYAGELARSTNYYRVAVGIADALYRRHPDNPAVLRRLSTERWALGTVLIDSGAAAEAYASLDRGEGEARRLVEFDAEDQDARRRLGILRLAKAQSLSALGRSQDAIDLLTNEAEVRRGVLAANPKKAEAGRDYAIALASLGDVQADAGRPAQACATYANGRAVFDDLRRAGRLTALDAQHALRALDERAAKACKGRTAGARAPA